MNRICSIPLLCFVLFACGEGQSQKEPATQMPPPSDTAIAQGGALYKRYGCAVCHGKSGRGNGQIARTLNPPPRNFQDPTAYRYGRSQEAIARTIKKGALNESGMGMPAYPQIPEPERNAIAAYIVTLQEKKPQ